MTDMPKVDIIQGDCLEWMRQQADNCVDLVFGSPPYEAARTYGIDFALKGQDWVDWMVERMVEMVRISNGLVAMVVEGQTRKFRWSATPALLMADLHRAGIHLRKPPVFHRVGIPGSGGPDWLRNDYEFIVCCTSGGKLPWSDNTAMGHPPKWAPGGAMSYRNSEGTRRNQWGSKTSGQAERNVDGVLVKRNQPSHVVVDGRDQWGGTPTRTSGTGRKTNGEYKRRFGHAPDGTVKGGHSRVVPHPQRKNQDGIRGEKRGTAPRYDGVAIANPGNVIHCKVGGGVMGNRLCHENEAPFPEALAEFFVRSFCPPGGVVLDPFCGSGTTAAVALMHGRNAIATDVRASQVELARQRISDSVSGRLF
jgi:hypothetical protein